MKKTVLFLGAYCGDWETEITLFKPYMRWISEIIEHDEIHLSTHSNRTFLYDWIPPKNIIHIYGNLSRAELSQKGVTNTLLSQKDYAIIQRQISSQIVNQYGKTKINFYNFTLNYTNRTVHYPLYKRIHEKITTPDFTEREDIIFIPDNTDSEKNIVEIYNRLKKDYNISVVGDMKTYLPEENEALRMIDYFENGYKYIVDRITRAKLVICPLGHWSYLCDIQGTPAVSWTTQYNKYLALQNSEYCFVINEYDTERVIATLKKFIEGSI